MANLAKTVVAVSVAVAVSAAVVAAVVDLTPDWEMVAIGVGFIAGFVAIIASYEVGRSSGWYEGKESISATPRPGDRIIVASPAPFNLADLPQRVLGRYMEVKSTPVVLATICRGNRLFLCLITPDMLARPSLINRLGRRNQLIVDDQGLLERYKEPKPLAKTAVV